MLPAKFKHNYRSTYTDPQGRIFDLRRDFSLMTQALDAYNSVKEARLIREILLVQKLAGMPGYPAFLSIMGVGWEARKSMDFGIAQELQGDFLTHYRHENLDSSSVSADVVRLLSARCMESILTTIVSLYNNQGVLPSILFPNSIVLSKNFDSGFVQWWELESAGFKYTKENFPYISTDARSLTLIHAIVNVLLVFVNFNVESERWIALR